MADCSFEKREVFRNILCNSSLWYVLVIIYRITHSLLTKQYFVYELIKIDLMH